MTLGDIARVCTNLQMIADKYKDQVPKELTNAINTEIHRLLALALSSFPRKERERLVADGMKILKKKMQEEESMKS